MSTKERVLLDFYWTALDRLNVKKGRAVSAGELAIEMGVCRNTAAKYLDRLYIFKSVSMSCIDHWNMATKRVYKTQGVW